MASVVCSSTSHTRAALACMHVYDFGSQVYDYTHGTLACIYMVSMHRYLMVCFTRACIRMLCGSTDQPLYILYSYMVSLHLLAMAHAVMHVYNDYKL